jgi:hypothetical protein
LRKSEEIISKKVLAFQQHADFELEEPFGCGETACLQRPRRHMPGRVTLPRDRRSSRMALTALPYLGSETPDARSAALKLLTHQGTDL